MAVHVMGITKEFFDLFGNIPVITQSRPLTYLALGLSFSRNIVNSFIRMRVSQWGNQRSLKRTPHSQILQRTQWLRENKQGNSATLVLCKIQRCLGYQLQIRKRHSLRTPEALGYRGSSLTNNDEFIQDYLNKIQKCTRIACYPELISRIELELLIVRLLKKFEDYKHILDNRWFLHGSKFALTAFRLNFSAAVISWCHQKRRRIYWRSQSCCSGQEAESDRYGRRVSNRQYRFPFQDW